MEDINFSEEILATNVPVNECKVLRCDEKPADEQPEGGCPSNGQLPQCCGQAPRLEIFTPLRGTCSSDGGKVIKPNIYTCQRTSSDFTLIVDTSAYNQSTFGNLTLFLQDWTSSMGLGDDSIFNIITYNQAANVHASQISSLSGLSNALASIAQTTSTTRNTFAALNFVHTKINDLSRDDKDNYFMLFTGGPSSDSNIQAAENLKSNGIVYSVSA